MNMPLGKYKGAPIEDVPTSYLEYLVGWDQLKDRLRVKIQTELSRESNVDQIAAQGKK